MALPPVSGSSPNPPHPNSRPDSSTEATRPSLPTGNNETPETPLGKRNASTETTAPVLSRQPLTPEEAKQRFIQQAIKVEALETRLKLVTEAPRMSNRLRQSAPNGIDEEVLIVHVGSDGQFMSVIPPDENLQNPVKAKPLKEHLANQFTQIHEACKDKVPGFKSELAQEKEKLNQYRQQLEEVSVTPPKVDLGYSGIRIDIDSTSTATPPALIPLPEVFSPHFPHTHSSPQPLLSEKATEPNTTVFARRPLISIPDDIDDDFPPPPPSFITPSEASVPDLKLQDHDLLIAGEKLLYETPAPKLFIGNSDKMIDMGNRNKGDKLVQFSHQMSASEDNDLDHNHRARKSLLFPLFMNLLQNNGHLSSKRFPEQAVPLYQIALAASKTTADSVLESKGSNDQRTELFNLLTQYEEVKPEVAEVIASDVSGTHMESSDFNSRLATAIVRDIERLEQARFSDALDIEDFEINELLKAEQGNHPNWPEIHKTFVSELIVLATVWIEQCASQGEQLVSCDIRNEGQSLTVIPASQNPRVTDPEAPFNQQKAAMITGKIKTLFEKDGSSSADTDDSRSL